MKKIIPVLIILMILLCSVTVIAEEVPFITYTDLLRYGELYPTVAAKYGMQLGTVPVRIEVVIGRESGFLHEKELWVKDSNGFSFFGRVNNLPYAFTYGQRYILEITPYSGGGFGEEEILKYELIEDNADVDSILSAYKEKFQPLSYRKVLRNPEKYKRILFVVEGIYFQDLGSHLGGKGCLLLDDDENVYFFDYFQKDYDINLLVGDRLKLYCVLGGPDNGIYQYQAWSGKQTVPYLYLYFYDLLEEE